MQKVSSKIHHGGVTLLIILCDNVLGSLRLVSLRIWVTFDLLTTTFTTLTLPRSLHSIAGTILPQRAVVA
jgi:hypothetical protein